MQQIHTMSKEQEKDLQEIRTLVQRLHSTQIGKYYYSLAHGLDPPYNITLLAERYFLDEATKRILSQISSIDFWTQHEENLDSKEPGTNKWIYNESHFQDWLSGRTKALWCHGMRKLILTTPTSTTMAHPTGRQQLEQARQFWRRSISCCDSVC